MAIVAALQECFDRLHEHVEPGHVFGTVGQHLPLLFQALLGGGQQIEEYLVIVGELRHVLAGHCQLKNS